MMHIRDQEIAFVTNSTIAVEDPAIDQFNLFIDFDAYSGLFAPETRKNSALAYLKRTGEFQAYELLQKSIILLQKILERSAYRLTQIDGIDALYTEGFKKGVITPLNLTFRETVDWEFRQILFGIAVAMYDEARQINILPLNLQRFSCIIYFRDARVLQSRPGFTDYKARYGYDVDNLPPTRGQYDLHRMNRDNQEDYPAIKIDDTQHIAIQIPICELVIPNLGLTANHIDMNPRDHSIVFNVRRYLTAGLFFDEAIVDPTSSLTQTAQTPEESKQERQAKLKTKLQVALLTQVNSLRDKTITNALLKYDSMSRENEILTALNRLVKPDAIWEGVQNEGFQNSYKVFVKQLDSSREQLPNQLTQTSISKFKKFLD